MTLIDRILNEIKKEGAISIDHYLNLCLYDEKEGYYYTKNAIGRDGDFITSPEMTQIFGELIALFILDQWNQAYEPKPIHLIECGPGNGTLMQDMVTTFKKFQPFYEHLRISMVETSPVLREFQKSKIDTNQDICWYTSLDDVPIFQGYTFVIANEFFDALPIKQFVNKDGCYVERMITANENDHIRFNFKDDDSLIEECPAYQTVIDSINKHLEETEGGVLIIDYGDYQRERFGDTLQGVKHHHYSSIFDTPGEVDISHQVNFNILSKLLSNNLNKSNIKSQGEFLQILGIERRLQSLLVNATPSQKMQLLSACARLISPQHMGNIFKILYASTHDSTFCRF